jgi:pimeloyl-ACP methyl ester carboxylesterase
MRAQGPWQHRSLLANGIRFHLAEAGEGFPVLLLHGFPELWYSWRYQLPALAAAGLRAIAPDLRGYGGSDKPPRIEDYDILHLVGDVVGLLDALGLERAVLVGHDWGGIIVWTAAVMHPQRVERVVSLNVPYRGRPGFPTTARLREMVESGAQQFSYVLTFQEPGRAEAIFAQDLPGRLRRLYQGVAGRPDFPSEEDFQVYLRAFQEGGLTGPLNYYRNIDRNWQLTDHLHDRQVACPALLVMTDKDPVLRPEMAEGMERWVPDLRLELIRDCGHWTQQERPEEVNRLLLEFLGDLARR